MANLKKKRVILLAIIFFVAFIPTSSVIAQDPIPPIIIEDLEGVTELEIGSILLLPIALYDDDSTGTYALQVNGISVKDGDWGIAEPRWL